MLGKIVDTSGSTVQNAKVEAFNEGTGAVFNALTDGEGEYRILNLSPGVYSVSASFPGFAVAKITGISLPARETVGTNLALQVAGTAEVVTVSADQQVVSEIPTQSSSRCGADINSLALNFRATNNTSPLQVAVLSPGVQTDQSGNVSISGGLPNSTSFSIDGVSTTQVRASGPNPDLPSSKPWLSSE
jgi:hypothetical protein